MKIMLTRWWCDNRESRTTRMSPEPGHVHNSEVLFLQHLKKILTVPQESSTETVPKVGVASSALRCQISSVGQAEAAGF